MSLQIFKVTVIVLDAKGDTGIVSYIPWSCLLQYLTQENGKLFRV